MKDSPRLACGKSRRFRDRWSGYAAEAPYDAIHVGAAAESVPRALVDQLKRGGRMVIPVGPYGGSQVSRVASLLRSRPIARSDLLSNRQGRIRGCDEGAAHGSPVCTTGQAQGGGYQRRQ